MGYLTPNTPAPTEYLCRRVRIPKDIAFISAVNGALAELVKPHNWEADGSMTPEQAAEIMLTMWLDYTEGNGCMIGLIVPFVSTTLPPHLLPCDGSNYSRADYPDLFSMLPPGLKYVDLLNGGERFVTPDLRGRTVIGAGSGAGLTYRSALETGGAETHALTVSELATHDHPMPHSHTLYEPSYIPFVAFSPGELPVQTPDVIPGIESTITQTPMNTVAVGLGTPHPNMQPYFALTYAIVAR